MEMENNFDDIFVINEKNYILNISEKIEPQSRNSKKAKKVLRIAHFFAIPSSRMVKAHW